MHAVQPRIPGPEGQAARRQRFRGLLAQRGPALIKCCGMFRERDIAAVNAALPDFCGFICEFPKSHRSLDAQRAAALAAQLDNRVISVAVCVDAPFGVLEQLDAAGLDVLQLHGSEDEAYIAQARKRCSAPIIKAFKVGGSEDVAAACQSSADMILLDSGQGSGQRFDWSLVAEVERPFMLAGGLSPENIAQALAQVQPWAVDLSSSLETNKLKDPERIQAAVRALRGAAGSQ